jgi:hypothetical protein
MQPLQSLELFIQESAATLKDLLEKYADNMTFVVFTMHELSIYRIFQCDHDNSDATIWSCPKSCRADFATEGCVQAFFAYHTFFGLSDSETNIIFQLPGR